MLKTAIYRFTIFIIQKDGIAHTTIMNCTVPALIILRLTSIAMCKDVFFVY